LDNKNGRMDHFLKENGNKITLNKEFLPFLMEIFIMVNSYLIKRVEMVYIIKKKGSYMKENLTRIIFMVKELWYMKYIFYDISFINMIFLFFSNFKMEAFIKVNSIREKSKNILLNVLSRYIYSI
jgi:hypothetical protein